MRSVVVDPEIDIRSIVRRAARTRSAKDDRCYAIDLRDARNNLSEYLVDFVLGRHSPSLGWSARSSNASRLRCWLARRRLVLARSLRRGALAVLRFAG